MPAEPEPHIPDPKSTEPRPHIPDLMAKLVALSKQRGFVFQSSEIYGGLKSCYDYGPLGAELKRNVKEAWWRETVHAREDVVGIDASILMHPKVCEASGHGEGFSDPLFDGTDCKARSRADKTGEDTFQNHKFQNKDKKLPIPKPEKLLKRVLSGKCTSCGTDFKVPESCLVLLFPSTGKLRQADEEGSLHTLSPFRCPHCDKTDANTSFDELDARLFCPRCFSVNLSEVRKFNLMLKTHLGAVEDSAAVVYLRPETAQAMFVDFALVQGAMGLKLPFGIAQVGKAFRNEVTVEHFTFRSCEFEQMEVEFFVTPGEDDKWLDFWKDERLKWYSKYGIREDRLRLRPHEADELAHYAKACYDIEYLYPWGWGELEGIANRTDYDLKRHAEFSGERLSYFDHEKKEHIVPYVIEPSAGAARAALAFLIDAYDEEPAPEGKKEGRTVLRLDPRLAPYKVAVFPLVKKDGMPEIAREIADDCWANALNARYDEQHSVGRRYRRHDEAGTPFCVTVDGQTKEDETVTIRERDSMKQERVKRTEVVAWVREKMRGR